MTIRISGNIWLSRIQPSPTLEIRPRCRARTYAAGSPISTARIALTDETLRLFQAAWMRPFWRGRPT